MTSKMKTKGAPKFTPEKVAELHNPPTRRVRRTKSGFGRQANSRHETAPSWGFGTSNREDADKRYINHEMNKKRPGLSSPGPIYLLRSSLGRQPKSDNISPPEVVFPIANRWKGRQLQEAPGPGSYKICSGVGTQVESPKKSPEGLVFGRATRDQVEKVFLSLDHDKSNYGKGSPGPSYYNWKSALGKQYHSQKRTSPSVAFTQANRFRYGYDDMPGPGQYNYIPAIGKQLESTKYTLPTMAFPHCDRDHRQKVFLSLEHDKCHYGEGSPGPAAGSAANPRSSIGRIVDSRYHTQPTIKFGTGNRFAVLQTEFPGPGAYEC